MDESGRIPVIDIFNHYVLHGMAAFPEHPLDYGFYDAFLVMRQGYPAFVVKDARGEVSGFGMLRAHSPMPTFRRSADVGYFLHPAHTGKGLGGNLLERLEDGARAMGIDTLLACVAAKNAASLKFHTKHGFVERGRFLSAYP
jgi:phosphinothricin acetyltransferase